MRNFTPVLLAAALIASTVVHAEDRCTAILVGAKASTTGTPMTTHTNDCSSCDFRIVKVPARKHAPGALHDVVLASFDYPRYVGAARGSEYLPENLDKRFFNWTATPSIGTIPEANETFAYIDGAYGIINEHQVAIGESTCGARFVSKPVSHGGAALFDIAELSRIALQRTTTARAAVQLMGDLAVAHGYYGAEWEGDSAFSEAGEALTVTDTVEAWMFHILPDDTGASAVWAAQRVPDDHITAVANQFVIRDLNVSDPTTCLASANVFDVAQRNGLWSNATGEPLDFARVFAQPREPGHQYYSTRRVWRVFTLADPALNLSADTDVFATDYPFSVAPAQALSPHDIMRFQRDHYEGTPYDMTKGPAGGPFGDPDRYDGGVNGNMTQRDVTDGAFERAISIFRASYSFVSVLDAASADNAFIWFGQYAPHATAYAPVYAKAAAIPVQYTRGSLLAFDKASSFWVHALVGNWAARFYKHAHPVVNKVQLELEALVADLQADLLAQAAVVKRNEGDAALHQFLADQSALFASQSHETFTQLFEYLVTIFHDGYEMSNLTAEHLTATPLFYPKWWLEQVGYYNVNASASANATSAMAAPENNDSVDADTIVFPPTRLPNASVVPSVTKVVVTKTPSATKATPTVPPAATTAAPTVVVATESPAPVTVTPVPALTTDAPAEVGVRSSSDSSSASTHTVSYWTTALFSVLSLVVGVIIGRTFKGFQQTGYRPIR